MIYNLFAYPSNFGYAQIYKCDYFGNSLSIARDCFIDQFIVNVEQQNVDDNLSYGSLVQNNTFKLNNRKINITADFLFNMDTSGLLSPAVDLLTNLCANAFQGTNISYKLSIYNLTTTSLYYYQLNIPISLNLSNSVISSYKFYLVNESSSIQLSDVTIDTTSGFLTFNSINYSGAYWLEIFQYGTNKISDLQSFPLYYEPMFRLDTSEGSFYNCLVEKLTFSLNDEFAKISAEIVAIDYDRSTRFNFINSSNSKSHFLFTKPLHRSRIKISDYTNDITSEMTFNVSSSTLESMGYLNGLLTQTFSNTPFQELSINIDNSLQPVYGNDYQSIRRTYVKGYYSKMRKISGNLSVLALRSDSPTFEKFAYLANSLTKSFTVSFGSQDFSIPYTVWKPGKVEANQSNYVKVSFEWVALANTQMGQPHFITNNAMNF